MLVSIVYTWIGEGMAEGHFDALRTWEKAIEWGTPTRPDRKLWGDPTARPIILWPGGLRS